MTRTSRDTEFSTFVEGHRVELLRAARLLTAGDRHLAEDLVQTALARLYTAWPRLRERPIAYAHRIIINAQFGFAPDTSFHDAALATITTAQQMYGTAAANVVRAAFHARGIPGI